MESVFSVLHSKMYLEDSASCRQTYWFLPVYWATQVAAFFLPLTVITKKLNAVSLG
jgi:hypothetical protein